MSIRVRRLTRRLLTTGLAAGLIASLGLAASPARAEVPQPGEVPWVNFDDAATRAGVRLDVSSAVRVGTHWVTAVSVCNYTGSPLPVGPDTFSYTNYNYGTFWFTVWTGTMPDQWLANGGCASGNLMSTEAPAQMAFHKILTPNDRIDILPSTEWEGIFNVREPKSPGATFVHGDYTGDSIADVNGVFGYNFYVFRTIPGPRLTYYSRVDTDDNLVNWMSKLPDVDRNGSSDLLVRTDDGSMWFQRVMEHGRLGFRNRIGTNWQGISLLAVVGRLPEGRTPWILARAANGNLIRYQMNPWGITNASVIGTNWQSISKLFSVGDFSGDGVPDLMAIGTNGLLYRYNMTEEGNIASVNVVGRYWQEMTTVFSPGDLDGDHRWDMAAVRADGNLYYYRNISPGVWGHYRQIGTNWDGLRTMA